MRSPSSKSRILPPLFGSLRPRKGRTRLLFGAVDLGWRIHLYTGWIERDLDHVLEVESFVKYKVSAEQYRTRYTYEVQYSDRSRLVQWTHALLFFLIALLRYDVFHFFSGETLLTRRLRRLEFRIYRLLRKRVIMHFVGTDIRNPERVVWTDRSMRGLASENERPPLSLGWQRRLVDDARKFADRILVSTPDLLEIVPEAEFLPVCIDLEHFDQECRHAPQADFVEKSGDLLLLHAPSNVRMKGTEILEPVVRRLEAEDPSLQVLLTNELEWDTGSVYTVPRLVLFGLYDRADVLVDQLTIGWYGLQSVEALLRGLVVVCGIRPDLELHLFDDCPILVTTPETLEADLRTAIARVRAGAVDHDAQREWVRRHHTMERYGPVLAEIWLDALAGTPLAGES